MVYSNLGNFKGDLMVRIFEVTTIQKDHLSMLCGVAADNNVHHPSFLK